MSEELVTREQIIADETIKASKFALENGVAMNIAGGTHQAFTNRGEGFCMLNDKAIGDRYLLVAEGRFAIVTFYALQRRDSAASSNCTT